MKKMLCLLLATSILLSGCGSSGETVVEKEISSTQEQSQSVPSQDTLSKEKIFSVDVTIPAIFYQDEQEEMTQDKVEQLVKESNFNSGVLNEDGSVTFNMSKSQHAQFLQSIKDSTLETIDGLLNGENSIESFNKISFNDDMNKFSIYVDATKYSAFDSLNALVFYLVGEYYQLFNGISLDDVDVQVDFIDKDTEQIIDTGKLSEMRSNLETSESSIDTENANVPEEDLNNQLQVNGEYYYTNSIGDTYYCLIVKNLSSCDLEINVNVIAKDENGNSIGATSSYQEAVAPSAETCLLCYFDSTENASSFEYTLDAQEDKYYLSVTNNLDMKINDTGKKSCNRM